MAIRKSTGDDWRRGPARFHAVAVNGEERPSFPLLSLLPHMSAPTACSAPKEPTFVDSWAPPGYTDAFNGAIPSREDQEPP